jgi:hypothetical protein
MTAQEWIGVLVAVVGMVAILFVTGRLWTRRLFRLLPFAYATVFTVIFGWLKGWSASELVPLAVGVNAGAAVLFFALWIQSPRSRR